MYRIKELSISEQPPCPLPASISKATMSMPFLIKEVCTVSTYIWTESS